jgi:hypothetical protein
VTASTSLAMCMTDRPSVITLTVPAAPLSVSSRDVPRFLAQPPLNLALSSIGSNGRMDAIRPWSPPSGAVWYVNLRNRTDAR